jgi:hypothetical protein
LFGQNRESVVEKLQANSFCQFPQLPLLVLRKLLKVGNLPCSVQIDTDKPAQEVVSGSRQECVGAVGRNADARLGPLQVEVEKRLRGSDRFVVVVVLPAAAPFVVVIVVMVVVVAVSAIVVVPVIVIRRVSMIVVMVMVVIVVVRVSVVVIVALLEEMSNLNIPCPLLAGVSPTRTFAKFPAPPCLYHLPAEAQEHPG